ncbi:MAG: hypothetical protein L3J36_06235 [Rhodobacteraceae bacterium]|nr:hypothetical protein [Paracoccaceae bacterium]
MRKLLLLLASLAALPAFAAQEGTRIQVKGEIIDTWCYYSGVMGGPDAVTGSAHHTCAMWCSAGGIPVGLLTTDGTVYMVLKIGGDTKSARGDTMLNLASHVVEADGIAYERDGINYLVVSQVITDHGITRHNHEEFGPVPGFAIPDPNK